MTRFYLLNPTAVREYAPLRELRTTIQQILECELVVSQHLRRPADISLHPPNSPTYLWYPLRLSRSR